MYNILVWLSYRSSAVWYSFLCSDLPVLKNQPNWSLCEETSIPWNKTSFTNISAWFESKSVPAFVHYMNRSQDKFPDFLQNADSNFENLHVLKHFWTLNLWIHENLQLLFVVFEYLRPADTLLHQLWGLGGIGFTLWIQTVSYHTASLG